MKSRLWVADERRQSLWCVNAVIAAGSGLLREPAVQCGQDGVCIVLLLFNKIPSDILELYKILKYINQKKQT